MSDDHKAALAQGRAEGRVVREYLDALRANKPKRGRKRTPDSINRRLGLIESEMHEVDPLGELRLVQERRDLVAELENMDNVIDLDAVEKAFVHVAGSYSARQGISYASWRDVGVSAAVLRRAGVARTR